MALTLLLDELWWEWDGGDSKSICVLNHSVTLKTTVSFWFGSWNCMWLASIVQVFFLFPGMIPLCIDRGGSAHDTCRVGCHRFYSLSSCV